MEGNEFCSEAQGLKKFESNKNAISPNVLFSSSNNKEMKQGYISKTNLEPKYKLTLLMITESEKFHFLVVKNRSRLLRGIISNDNIILYLLLLLSESSASI